MSTTTTLFKLVWDDNLKRYVESNISIEEYTSDINYTVIINTSNIALNTFNQLIKETSNTIFSDITINTSNTNVNNSNSLINIINQRSNLLILNTIQTSNNLINYTNLTSNNLINYTNLTSNNLINYTNLTSNNLISYTNLTSNNLINYTNLTSNILIRNTSNTSNNLINYTNQTSNNLIGYTNQTSNNLIVYTNQTSNNLFINNSNTSNNLINYNNQTSNNLFINTSNTSNNLIGYTNQTSNNLIRNTSNTSNNLINYTNQTSNNLIGYTNLTSNNLIGYTNLTSNNLIGYTNLTSNNLFINTSNTSNNLITYTNQTSNNLIRNTSNTSNNLIGYTNLTSNNLIGYTNLTSNNLIGYTNLTSNNLIGYTNLTSNNLIGYTNLTSNNLIGYTNLTSNNIIKISSNDIYKSINDTNKTLSNYTNTIVNSLTTDLILSGNSNKFIVNNIYNNNLLVNGIFTSCNITTSNLNVTGSYNIINTNSYNTENLEIENQGTSTALIIKQFAINYNVAEFYNNTNPTFIISSYSNIGIGKINPDINYKLDINGALNASEVFINNNNLTQIITNNSNNLFSYTNQTSNNVINYNNQNSNNLFGFINQSSNNLIGYTNLTSNNLFINTSNSSNNSIGYTNQLSNNLIINTSNTSNNIINNLIGYTNQTSNNLIVFLTDYFNEISNSLILDSTNQLTNMIFDYYNQLSYNLTEYNNQSSNNLINYNNISSNNLIINTSNTSNNLIEYIINISNILIEYNNLTSNNLIGYNNESSNNLFVFLTEYFNEISNSLILDSTNQLTNMIFDYYNQISYNLTEYNNQSSNNLIDYNNESCNSLIEYTNLTSNNLIYYTNQTSNNLIIYTSNSSNNLIEYTNQTSNNLIGYTNQTSNNLIDYTNYTNNKLIEVNSNNSNFLWQFTNITSNDLITYNNQNSNKLINYNNLINTTWINNGNNIYNNNLGNVGIGITNPTSRLHIQTSGANINNLLDFRNTANFGIYVTSINIDSRGNTFDFLARDYNNGGTIQTKNLLSLRPEGNIGIGNTDPQFKLDVTGDCRINTNTGYLYAGDLRIAGWDKLTSIYQQTGNLGISANSGNNIIFSIGTGNEIMRINANGNIGIGSTIPNERLDISSGKVKTAGILNNSNLIIQTTTNDDIIFNTNNSEKLRILANGNIGIGINNPSVNLEVSGENSTIRIIDSTSTRISRLEFIRGSSTYGNDIYTDWRIENNGNLNFHRQNSSTIGTAMTILANGDVGIGITLPLYKLDVVGNINYSGTLFKNGVDILSSINNSINTDLIQIGTSNKFITNNTYNNNLSITGELNVSNIITSNIKVIGSSTLIETDIYRTEKLEIINEATGTSLKVQQLAVNQNIAEFYNNTNPIFVISSNSNIGIGITNPQQKLHMNGALYIDTSSINPGNSSSASFWNQSGIGPTISGANFSVQTNGTTEAFRITSSGNIGIGLTNPNYTLDLLNTSGSANKPFIRLRGGGTANNEVGIILNPFYNRSGAIASKIYAIDDGNASAHLCFATASTGTSTEATERLRIKNDGNIGIGVTNPQYKLDINGDINCTGNFKISGVAFTGSSQWITNGTNIYNSNSGYVGIGTTNPKYSLDINSNINYSGTLYQNGNDIISTTSNYLVNYNNLSNIPFIYSSLYDSHYYKTTFDRTIISNTSFLFKSNYIISINNTNNYSNINGTSNITFNNILGTININSIPPINDNSYPILKDLYGNNINPLIWYKFDNSITNMLIDSSGNGYNLTNSNAIFDNTNKIKGDGSVSYTATTQYLSISNTNIPFYNLQISTGISISLWYKISSSINYGEIFRYIATNGNNLMLRRRETSTNSLDFAMWINNGYADSILTLANVNYFNNTWNHIVWSISTTGAWSIYINNVNQNINITRSFQIGHNTQSTTNFGNGIIGNLDDFRIYSKVLTQQEINELYNGSVRIYSNENNERIGIGKTNPSYSLDVNGTIKTNELLINDTNIYDEITSNIATLNYFIEYNNSLNSNLVYITNLNFSNVASNISNINPTFYKSNSNIYSLPNFNVGIGITNPIAPFQIGLGGKFSISSNDNDRTIIGTNDTDNLNNTSIILSGRTRTNSNGFIEYNATNNGNHIWTVNDNTNKSEKMRLTTNGNLAINITNPNSIGKLQVRGEVNFHAGNPSAVPNNYMQDGSLTIGDVGFNYGGGNSWNTNTAGLLMECADNTEIAVHDSGNRVSSLIFYAGGGNWYHEYGRNMGWGHPNQHFFRCNTLFEVYFTGGAGGWQYFKLEPTSLWGDGLGSASEYGGTKYLTARMIMYQAPHIVPNAVGQKAYIRYGRAGGIQSGTWWETACRTDGRFQITREGNDSTNGVFIDTVGKLAINNATPLETLHVQGTIASINAAQWDHIRMWTDGSIAYIDAGGAENGLAFRINNGGSTYPASSYPEVMRILLNGNVGIGNAGPTAKLHVELSTTTTTMGEGHIYCYNPTNATNNKAIIINRIAGSSADKAIYSLDVNGQYGWAMYISGNDTTNKTLRFNNSWFGGSTDYLTIKGSDGNLGIGVATAGFKLEVASGSGTTGNISLNYFNGSTAPNITTTTVSDICAKFNSSIWCTNWIASSSDERIKTDIQDIDDTFALNKIMQIQPKKYKYINNIEKGNNEVYGFIAQQIKEVIPEAVTTQKGIIPNLFKVFNKSDLIIETDIDYSSILAINDYIECIIENDSSKKTLLKITDIISTSITIETDDEKIKEANKIFIIGKQINDFHILSKEYIFTLNVCATQELYKMINDLQQQINELKNK